MARSIDWERWIGRRLRLQDLHVLFTVVKLGSMAKAAQQLGVTQPAVSKVIADLEHTLEVRLLDRGRRGVEPTMYGKALLKRGTAAFDELRQGVMDIEFLTDPTSGELRIGCSDPFAAANLPPILYTFSRRYPRVGLSVIEIAPPISDPAALEDRKCDIILGRMEGRPAKSPFAEHVNVESIYEDRLVVAAGSKSCWARRRKIDLAELCSAPWVLPGKNTWNYHLVAEAFQSRGLPMPTIILLAQSSSLRSHFLTHGDYIGTFAGSVLRYNAELFGLKELPVHLTDNRSFIGIVTLKNRTLSPVAEFFIDHVREVTKPMRSNKDGDHR
jgi:DNA-binding transcriptional LysR family regulator